MSIKRVPVETVADQTHGSIMLEGDTRDSLPSDRVYVNPSKGEVVDGQRGGKLGDLAGDEIEMPRTRWYGEAGCEEAIHVRSL